MVTAKLIANPVAGRGRTTRHIPDIRRGLQSLNIETDLVWTRAPGEASELAALAKGSGYVLVIAAGGDGTIQEVTTGLIAAAGGAVAGTLGIIPLGMNNALIKTLNVPKDWRAACAKLADGKKRRIDVGCINGNVFMNSVGVAFEAQAGSNAQKIRGWLGAGVDTAALTRTTLLSHNSPRVSMKIDGATVEQQTAMVTIAIGRCSGGNFCLPSDAQIDDGMFDVLIAQGPSKSQVLGWVPSMMLGTHSRRLDIRRMRAAHISIHSEEPLPVYADGEVLYTVAHQLDLHVLPRKLDVIG